MLPINYNDNIYYNDITINIITYNLTLYGPNSFFRRFSGHNLR